MTSEIVFWDKTKGDKWLKTIYCICDGYPENVWQDIKQAIKELQNDTYHEGKTLTFKDLVERMLCFDDYRVNPVDIRSDEIINVYYCESFIKIENDNFTDTYITKKDYNGNCIDDFVFRGVQSRIDVINEYIHDIQQRVEERTSTNEYHQTSCYEKDFLQIFLIQKNAQKIVDNCKKQLELISEKYTKLD